VSDGKRGRGAGNKTLVFGIFKRHGKVFTEIVPPPPRRVPGGVRRHPGPPPPN